MTDPKAVLAKLHQNLNILREREAKYAGNAPLDLLNQIDDHHKAIALTEQALRGELSEAEWREALKPLVLAVHDGQVINIEAQTYVAGDQHIYQAAEEPPFWRRLSRANLILAIVLGIMATAAAVLAVPGVSDRVYGLFAPAPFASATAGETLIVIAAFHETGATHTEPHVKIKRGIEEAAHEVGLNNLRVGLDPIVLTADQREQAAALGKHYNASLVIWGEDTGVEVFVYFLNLKRPDFAVAEVKISETERTQLANPSEYAKFITTDLPAQLTFLSLFAVGQSYVNQTQYPEAIKVIEKAVASLPPDIISLEGTDDAYFLLGWLYQQPNGDLGQAIKNYNKALELNPEYAAAYNGRGIAYYTSGDLGRAIKDYNKALELEPKYAVAYNNRGTAYHASGDLRQAVQDYNKATELDPNKASYWNSLCWVSSLFGNASKFMDACERAVELAPDNGWYRDSRGLARALSGNYEGAIADFEFAVEWLKKNGKYNQYGPKREAWITALKAGHNPFDEETLEKLRKE